jgi:hypothetical protein
MPRKANMNCPRCGAEMNQHAEKLTYSSPAEEDYNPTLGGFVEEFYACPVCGATASRRNGL